MTNNNHYMLRSFLGLILLVVAVPLMADEDNPRLTPLVRAVQRVRASVVNIHTEKTTYPEGALFAGDKPRKVSGMGSGIIIDSRGYIVTNYHVIKGVDRESLEVTLDGGSIHHAEIVSFDSAHDLAILKIESARPLQVMPLGTSSDLMLAETVIALGNPYGYKHTITSGIVSSLDRDVEVDEHQKYENLIQTDTSINPGNSGGPLVSLEGKVVGINVAIRAGAQRIGFAIPIDDARMIIRNLLSLEKLEHVAHGVVGYDYKTGKLSEMQVKSTYGPAKVAGLKSGDVILQVDSKKVADSADFERYLLGRSSSEPIDILVRRGDNEERLSMRLPNNSSFTKASSSVASSQNDGQQSIWTYLGMRLSPVSVSSSRYSYRAGMKVLNVKESGPAAKTGIRTGDVLVGLHNWQMASYDNVAYVLEHPKLSSFSPLQFHVLRNQELLKGYMKLNLDQTASNDRVGRNNFR